MRNTFILLLLLVGILFLVPSLSHAAVPPTPVLDSVQNFGGALVSFWHSGVGAVPSGTIYHLYISTFPISSYSVAQLEANPMIQRVQKPYDSERNMNYTYYPAFTSYGSDNPVLYYVRVAAKDYSDDSLSVAASVQRFVFLQFKRTTASISSVTVDGHAADTSKFGVYTLDHDSSTIKFNISLTAEDGTPTLNMSYVRAIIRKAGGSDLFSEKVYLPITINVSSTSYSATASYTWNGYIESDGGGQHKHNGPFVFLAAPIDYYGYEYLETIERATYGIENFYVDVVHTNIGKGIVYQTLGSNQPHYGPPFYFDYYLSKGCFVTWKIYDRNQTYSTVDDTLVRTVVSDVPRAIGDSSSDSTDWDTMKQVEVWDGRDDKGKIVKNGIYRYTFESKEFWGEPATGYVSSAITDSYMYEGTIAFDALRIVDVSAIGIDETNALAHIKYTLGGANSLMGGASLKIVICTPGTTFYMATKAGTTTYLDGAATYYYKIGDPFPSDPNTIKKIFNFQRIAGVLDESWNGYDEQGVPLPNSTYVFAIAGVDDSGNRAVDSSGNDRLILGNITIDRTAAQEAGDASAPTISAVAVGGTAITSGGSNTLTQPFTTITVTLADTGGSGVDLTGSAITLSGPSASITTTATNDGQSVITLTCVQQSTNGTYTLRVTPKDKAGNAASDTIYSFTLSITQAGAQAAFEQSIYAFPNPAKNINTVSFSYNVSAATNVKLEVFNILGELVYDEEWNVTTTGTLTKVWDIVNKSGKELASGVYLYRITLGNVTSTKDLKKLVVVQ